MGVMVRAKFIVTSITRYGGEMTQIKLSPVMSGCEENKSFAKYTPSGEISLSVSVPETAKLFDIDKEFYVDFTEAPKAQ